MKKIPPIYFLLSFFTLSCSAQNVQKTEIETPRPEVKAEVPLQRPIRPPKDLPKKGKDCICIKMWMPVCGEDLKTYGNSCEAQCAGVNYTMGECQATK